jgi:hypothetical protein
MERSGRSQITSRYLPTGTKETPEKTLKNKSEPPGSEYEVEMVPARYTATDGLMQKCQNTGDYYIFIRSQWPHSLKHGMSSPVETLGSWVRIPLKAWMSAFILFVLYCVSSGLATG